MLPTHVQELYYAYLNTPSLLTKVQLQHRTVRYCTAVYRTIRWNNATYSTIRYFDLWIAILLASPHAPFISFLGNKFLLHLSCTKSYPPITIHNIANTTKSRRKSHIHLFYIPVRDLCFRLTHAILYQTTLAKRSAFILVIHMSSLTFAHTEISGLSATTRDL